MNKLDNSTIFSHEGLHKYLIWNPYLKETKHFEDKQVPNTFSLNYNGNIYELSLKHV